MSLKRMHGSAFQSNASPVVRLVRGEIVHILRNVANRQKILQIDEVEAIVDESLDGSHLIRCLRDLFDSMCLLSRRPMRNNRKKYNDAKYEEEQIVRDIARQIIFDQINVLCLDGDDDDDDDDDDEDDGDDEEESGLSDDESSDGVNEYNFQTMTAFRNIATLRMSTDFGGSDTSSTELDEEDKSQVPSKLKSRSRSQSPSTSQVKKNQLKQTDSDIELFIERILKAQKGKVQFKIDASTSMEIFEVEDAELVEVCTQTDAIERPIEGPNTTPNETKKTSRNLTEHLAYQLDRRYSEPTDATESESELKISDSYIDRFIDEIYQAQDGKMKIKLDASTSMDIIYTEQEEIESAEICEQTDTKEPPAEGPNEMKKTNRILLEHLVYQPDLRYSEPTDATESENELKISDSYLDKYIAELFQTQEGKVKIKIDASTSMNIIYSEQEEPESVETYTQTDPIVPPAEGPKTIPNETKKTSHCLLEHTVYQPDLTDVTEPENELKISDSYLDQYIEGKVKIDASTSMDIIYTKQEETELAEICKQTDGIVPPAEGPNTIQNETEKTSHCQLGYLLYQPDPEYIESTDASDPENELKLTDSYLELFIDEIFQVQEGRIQNKIDASTSMEEYTSSKTELAEICTQTDTIVPPNKTSNRTRISRRNLLKHLVHQPDPRYIENIAPNMRPLQLELLYKDYFAALICEITRLLRNAHLLSRRVRTEIELSYEHVKEARQNTRQLSQVRNLLLVRKLHFFTHVLFALEYNIKKMEAITEAGRESRVTPTDKKKKMKNNTKRNANQSESARPATTNKTNEPPKSKPKAKNVRLNIKISEPAENQSKSQSKKANTYMEDVRESMNKQQTSSSSGGNGKQKKTKKFVRKSKMTKERKSEEPVEPVERVQQHTEQLPIDTSIPLIWYNGKRCSCAQMHEFNASQVSQASTSARTTAYKPKPSSKDTGYAMKVPATQPTHKPTLRSRDSGYAMKVPATQPSYEPIPSSRGTGYTMKVPVTAPAFTPYILTKNQSVHPTTSKQFSMDWSVGYEAANPSVNLQPDLDKYRLLRRSEPLNWNTKENPIPNYAFPQSLRAAVRGGDHQRNPTSEVQKPETSQSAKTSRFKKRSKSAGTSALPKSGRLPGGALSSKTATLKPALVKGLERMSKRTTNAINATTTTTTKTERTTTKPLIRSKAYDAITSKLTRTKRTPKDEKFIPEEELLSLQYKKPKRKYPRQCESSQKIPGSLYACHHSMDGENDRILPSLLSDSRAFRKLTAQFKKKAKLADSTATKTTENVNAVKSTPKLERLPSLPTDPNRWKLLKMNCANNLKYVSSSDAVVNARVQEKRAAKLQHNKYESSNTRSKMDNRASNRLTVPPAWR